MLQGFIATPHSLVAIPLALTPHFPTSQCNDAYSALVVATELAKALKTDFNGLPLSLDLSWIEHKCASSCST